MKKMFALTLSLAIALGSFNLAMAKDGRILNITAQNYESEYNLKKLGDRGPLSEILSGGSVMLDDKTVTGDALAVTNIVRNDKCNLYDEGPGPIDVRVDGELPFFSFTPYSAVTPDTTLTFKISKYSSGKFIKEDMPEAEYKTNKTGLSYSDIMNGGDTDEILRKYVKGEGTNELPYNAEYVDEYTVKVTLCPISAEDAYTYNSSVTEGIARYNIVLPIRLYKDEIRRNGVVSYKGDISMDIDCSNDCIYGKSWTNDRSAIASNPIKTVRSSGSSGGKKGKITKSDEVTTVTVESTTEATTADLALTESKEEYPKTFVQKASGAVMTALRKTVESIAEEVSVIWNGADKSASVVIGDNKAVFKSGSSSYEVNGEKLEMNGGSFAEIVDDVMYVPAELINNAFDTNK